MAGLVSTLAGFARVFGYADGVGSLARFYAPFGVSIDPTGTFALVVSTYVRRGSLGALAHLERLPLFMYISRAGRLGQ